MSALLTGQRLYLLEVRRSRHGLRTKIDCHRTVAMGGVKAVVAHLLEPQIVGQTTNIDLFRNPIGTRGAKLFAGVIASPNTMITCIDLGYCRIGTEGMKAIASALPHSRIMELGLSGNFIGDEGAKALAEVLPRCMVEDINLCNNKIAGDGAAALAEAIPISVVSKVDMFLNDVGDTNLLQLIRCLSGRNMEVLALVEESPPLGDGFALSGKFDALPNEVMVGIAAAAKSALRYSWSSKRFRDCGLAGYVAALMGFGRSDRRLLYR